MMWLEMEAELGAEAAGEISFEVQGVKCRLSPDATKVSLHRLQVSSPGAERILQLPEDLFRFQKLPLRVEYSNAQGVATTQVRWRLEGCPLLVCLMCGCSPLGDGAPVV